MLFVSIVNKLFCDIVAFVHAEVMPGILKLVLGRVGQRVPC